MTNGVEPLADRGVCLPELIAARAARDPGAVAVVLGDEEVGYRELDERANRLGRHLRDAGVGPDVVVGLYLERSVEMIVGVLAVLKAGGAYLPLDVGLPAERLAAVLDAARPALVLTQADLAVGLPDRGTPTVCVDRDREAIAARTGQAFDSGLDPANLAYVIYTSGSTGVPKGIMIDHRALRDRIEAKASAYGIGEGDRILQFTALGFDASADEIYPTLLSGAALVVHPRPKWTSPPELVAECERRGVTGVMLPPVYLQLLVDTMASTGLSVPWLRLFITGGESIPVERLAAWARLAPHRPRFFYAYGPTETTIAATMYEAPTDPAEIERLAKVPIGRALPRTGTYVLDEWLRPVDDGRTGELWISGPGLARGYLGDPALTAERFMPCPFGTEAGARMYRTGDLVKVTPSGDLEFIGRVDDQVKIRGYRVDLGDVESALGEHHGVGPVVVTYNGRLVAYWVPRPGARPTAAELRGFLGGKLPDYMIPSAFVELDALPLAPGGKIDRRALPEPADDDPAAVLVGGEATSPVELLLSRIWCGLLRRDRIGVGENFFEAGGDSLLANQVVARVRDEMGVRVPLRTLFDAPTIEDLARAVTSLSVSADGTDVLALLADIEQMAETDAVVGPRSEEWDR